ADNRRPNGRAFLRSSGAIPGLPVRSSAPVVAGACSIGTSTTAWATSTASVGAGGLAANAPSAIPGASPRLATDAMDATVLIALASAGPPSTPAVTPAVLSRGSARPVVTAGSEDATAAFSASPRVGTTTTRGVSTGILEACTNSVYPPAITTA